MKSCSTCGLWKSDAEFYPDRRVPKRARDGLHHACKDCERDAARRRSSQARTREQTQVGKNLCPINRTMRGRKGAAASGWSKHPHCNTRRASHEFAIRRPLTQT